MREKGRMEQGRLSGLKVEQMRQNSKSGVPDQILSPFIHFSLYNGAKYVLFTGVDSVNGPTPIAPQAGPSSKVLNYLYFYTFSTQYTFHNLTYSPPLERFSHLLFFRVFLALSFGTPILARMLELHFVGFLASIDTLFGQMAVAYGRTET